MRYESIPTQLFVENRQKLSKRLLPNSIVIHHSNDQMPRSGDTFFPFRQNSDFFYLTGIDQEDSVVILYPDCPKDSFQEILFVKKTDEFIRIWEGDKLTQAQAKEISGIQKIFWLEDMENILHELILLSTHVYVNANENDRYTSEVILKNERSISILKDKYPAHSYQRLAPLMKSLTMIKSSWEHQIMQQAVNITDAAFKRVLQYLQPGVKEYEIEAEITHEFIKQGANGHAYEPIIASGGNANILHYIQNNQLCKAGDLILMDFGCEYANYASDLTRTIPVNGKFTARQKAVYESVLHVKEEATKMLVEGVILKDYEKEVGKIMTSELLKLGLLDHKDVLQQSEDRPAYKKYYMHGTSHHLGLDVHDKAFRYQPLANGMVVTCEPGIYIREENIGVRIENDIIISGKTPIDMMKIAGTPETVQAIEAWMNGEI